MPSLLYLVCAILRSPSIALAGFGKAHAVAGENGS